MGVQPLILHRMNSREAEKASIRLKTTETVDSCTLCDDTGIEENSVKELSYCAKCSFYFLNPRPEQEQIIASYNSGQTFDDWQKELPKRIPLWEKRLKLVLRYKTSGRLLDVGTGDGHFLEFASRHFDVDATEISSRGIAYAQKRGFSPFQGGLEAMDPHSGSPYDVITLWHVFEHLPDPGKALERIIALLKPGGILVIAVPNETINLLKVKSLFLQNPKNWPSYNRGKEIHLNYFIPKSLKNSVKRAGLRIVTFGVDDVHLWRNAKVLLFYYANCFLNVLFRRHMGRAMTIVAKKPSESRDILQKNSEQNSPNTLNSLP